MRWMMLGVAFSLALVAASCGRVGDLERPAAVSALAQH